MTWWAASATVMTLAAWAALGLGCEGRGPAASVPGAQIAYSQVAAAAAGLSKGPEQLDLSKWGRASFIENWETFDAGPDQVQAYLPHRWRTVLGYGGPLSADNRTMASTVFVDPSFSGVQAGRVGAAPLGLNPFRLQNRSLTILANRTPPALQARLFGKPYYSGIITTKFSFSQRYGYFEIKARLPKGAGFYPAFWLLPLTQTWPKNGEIDVFEYLGRTPNLIYSTLHHTADPAGHPHRISLDFDPSAGPHTFGVLYGPRYISWYIDRKKVAEEPTPAEMNQPMYMLLDLAVGGDWAMEPTPDTQFPGAFTIDSVQVWRMPG